MQNYSDEFQDKLFQEGIQKRLAKATANILKPYTFFLPFESKQDVGIHGVVMLTSPLILAVIAAAVTSVALVTFCATIALACIGAKDEALLYLTLTALALLATVLAGIAAALAPFSLIASFGMRTHETLTLERIEDKLLKASQSSETVPMIETPINPSLDPKMT